MDDRELTAKALGVARTLTYNEEPQGAAKHLLRELAHRLDTRSISAHKKADGWLLVNGHGKCRFMTWRERLAWALCKALPPKL